MITTGSKLLIGSAAAAWIFAAVYGITQEGTLGTIGLISAAVALSLLAGINVFARDSNVSAMDTESFETSAAAQATARPSLWPLLMGIGVTTLTLGLVTLPAVFIVGLVLVMAAGVEWLVQGWSERASADAAYNAGARNLMIGPLELPIAGAILFGVVVYAFSRVMLGLPSKSATVVAFAVVAAVVLVVGAFLGSQRRFGGAAITGTLSVALVALIAVGAVYGFNGERDIHEHETTGDLAETDECGVEETEADEKASQTVSAKSNAAAELTFDGSALTANVPGSDGDFDQLTLPRSNPSNILFRNESEGEARLVVELHPAVGDDGQPLGPERVCTALVDEGGVQLLTVVFTRPSFAVEEGYAFTVAGTDAELGVVVP